jgi:hypothetical protein
VPGLYENKVFRRVSIAVGALLLLTVWLRNLVALSNGDVWIGRNYWNQPIDTWGQLIVLVFVTAFGAYWLVRNRRWWL